MTEKELEYENYFEPPLKRQYLEEDQPNLIQSPQNLDDHKNDSKNKIPELRNQFFRIPIDKIKV